MTASTPLLRAVRQVAGRRLWRPVVVIGLAVLVMTSLSVVVSPTAHAGGGRQPATLAVTPAVVATQPGAVVDVDIMLGMDAGSHAVSSVTATIGFDPNVVYATSVVANTSEFPQLQVIEQTQIGPGIGNVGLTVNIGSISTTAIQASAKIATVRLQVVGGDGTTTPISWSRAEAYSLSEWDQAAENVVGSTTGSRVDVGNVVQCPDAFEPDNSVAQARQFAVGSLESRAFCVPGDQDWVTFDGVAGNAYRIETLNLSAGNDTFVELYAADGTTLLASNDDSNGTFASTVDHTATTTGPYRVKVRHYSSAAGSPDLTYDLRVSRQCVDAFEPNDSAAQARAFTVGATERHSYCVPGDQDWLSFAGTAGTTYRIETLNLASGNDTYLELYAANGTSLLASDDDAGGNLASLLQYAAPSTGTYFVKSRNFASLPGGPDLTYEIRVSVAPPPSLLVNGSFETDGNLDGRPDTWTSNANFQRGTAAPPVAGSYVGRFQSTSDLALTVGQTVPGLTAGRSYVAGCSVRLAPAAGDAFTMKVQIVWKNASGVNVRTDVVKSYSQTSAKDIWNRASRTAAAPAGAVSAAVQLKVSSLTGAVYVDDCTFTAQ